MSLSDSATCATPCAGIIRFRFRRSAEVGWVPNPPSQPSGRAPVWSILARGVRLPAATVLPHLDVPDPRERLRSARLYLVCDDQPDEFLAAALGGGVDIVQLRMKDATDDEIVAAGRRFASVAAEHGALFILNDRPDLVAATGADGVHVGQDDAAVADARAAVGPDRHRRAVDALPDAGRRRGRAGGRLHRRRTRPRDADQAGTAGGRARARPLRGGARDRPVLRDRRHLAGERRRGARGRRHADRGRPRADRRARRRGRRPRAPRRDHRRREAEARVGSAR